MYSDVMSLDDTGEPLPQDRRVQRSRSALMAAAVRLVSERGTTAIPVTDLAEAANVSRQLVYLQFGDRDALLTEAALDLLRREFLPEIDGNAELVPEVILAATRHFAQHRPFYRAMLTGSCVSAMTSALSGFFRSLNRPVVRRQFGDLDDITTTDLTVFITSGTTGVINDWLIYGADPLDPEELAKRLLRVAALIGSPNDLGRGGHAQ